MRTISTHKHIVIDTEQYAGNFEREMVAYITGLTGECGVGENTQKMAEAELTDDDKKWFDANVHGVSDDHGCNRPAFIVPTPGWGNDGKGNHAKVKEGKEEYPAYLSVGFRVSDWPEIFVLHTIMRRAQKFCEEFTTISRFVEGSKPLTFTRIRFVTEETTEKTIKEFEGKDHVDAKS